jgi:DNA-binding response OmpR family regulator
MSRVLIAEDSPEIRLLVSRVLATEGYDVSTVDDGREAIAKIREQHFDAILLDFMMPHVSGFGVIDWIQENRPDVAKSCVIVMTAAMHELKKFDTSTVFATITKPFDVYVLRDTVRKCIDSHPHPTPDGA